MPDRRGLLCGSAIIATVTIAHAPAGYECPFCAIAAGVDPNLHELPADNEPAGNQDAWHYASMPYPEFVTAGPRQPYAERLSGFFDARRHD